MFKTFFYKTRSDRGDSNIVTSLIVLPIFLGILFTSLDMGMYFSNKTIITSVVKDAARTVAIYGGAGSKYQQTPIEATYGLGMSVCSDGFAHEGETVSSDLYLIGADLDAYQSDQVASRKLPINNGAECGLWDKLRRTKGLTSVVVTGVKCGPSEASAVGEQMYCQLDWQYRHLPGSGMGFIAAGTKNVTKQVSASEVQMPGLVAR